MRLSDRDGNGEAVASRRLGEGECGGWNGGRLWLPLHNKNQNDSASQKVPERTLPKMSGQILIIHRLTKPEKNFFQNKGKSVCCLRFPFKSNILCSSRSVAITGRISKTT